MAKILYGKPVADAIIADAAKRAQSLKERGVTPALAIIRANAESGRTGAQYEQLAMQACAAAGVEAYSAYIPDERRLRANVDNINRDASIHGAIFLRPLPSAEASDLLREKLNPVKDVDGVTISSLSAIFAGHGPAFVPCPAMAALRMLEYYGVPVEGRHVALISREMVIGKALAMLLLERGAIVTLCNNMNADLRALCLSSDIVVSGTNIPGVLGEGCFRAGQTVLDVGDSLPGEGHGGDVDVDAALAAGADVAPVQGGVDTASYAMVALHTAMAAEILSRNVRESHID